MCNDILLLYVPFGVADCCYKTSKGVFMYPEWHNKKKSTQKLGKSWSWTFLEEKQRAGTNLDCLVQGGGTVLNQLLSLHYFFYEIIEIKLYQPGTFHKDYIYQWILKMFQSTERAVALQPKTFASASLEKLMIKQALSCIIFLNVCFFVSRMNCWLLH